MRLLVTAGNTQTPIDRVRCLTNIFTGRTGAVIAATAWRRGSDVTLLTSHPEAVPADDRPHGARWRIEPYRTFDDLQSLMATHASNDSFDAVIHCAAVGDYHSAGVYAPTPGTRFDTNMWTGDPPRMSDRGAGKIKSDEPELWLRLVRAPKLIDRIRTDWRFAGVLVKFKLEVGMDEVKLLEVAERSRQQSGANLMVANTLEGASEWAYLGPLDGVYHKIARPQLADRLLDAVESARG